MKASGQISPRGTGLASYWSGAMESRYGWEHMDTRPPPRIGLILRAFPEASDRIISTGSSAPHIATHSKPATLIEAAELPPIRDGPRVKLETYQFETN